MAELWYAVLCFTLVVFAVRGGADLGAGALNLVLARTGAERREVVAAIGSGWIWNETWLVVAGGTFFLAFPRGMAVAFAGFYLALWLVLWSLAFRGIALEVGGHIKDPLWQSFWDLVLAVSSLLLAVLFGVAFGNVLRGVALDESGKFTMSFFTDFGVHGRLGILDWYTGSVALFTLVLLAGHGASSLALRTRGRVHERSVALAPRLWALALGLFVLVSLETWVVRPELFEGLVRRPLGWLAGALAVAGAFAILVGLRRHREGLAVAGSVTVIVALLAGAAVAIFPVLLHSTVDPAYSATAYNTAAGGRSLVLAALWLPVALGLAAVQYVFLRRHSGAG